MICSGCIVITSVWWIIYDSGIVSEIRMEKFYNTDCSSENLVGPSPGGTLP